MRKMYGKPEVTWMRLRPEERLASSCSGTLVIFMDYIDDGILDCSHKVSATDYADLAASCQAPAFGGS